MAEDEDRWRDKEDKINKKAVEPNRVEEVWVETLFDTLAELWAAFLHAESLSQIQAGWLLRPPHAVLDRLTSRETRASSPLSHRSQTGSPPYLYALSLHPYQA